MTQVLIYLSNGCFHTNHFRAIPFKFLYSQNNIYRMQLCAHYIYQVFFIFAASHQKMIQHFGAVLPTQLVMTNTKINFFLICSMSLGVCVSCSSWQVYLRRVSLFSSWNSLKAQTIHKCNLLIIYFFAWLENSSYVKLKLWIFSLQTSRHLIDKWNSG